MIKRIEKEEIAGCVKVIRESFLTVADEFGFTALNAPRFTAFATTEERLNYQMDVERRFMYAYYDKDSIVGYYSLVLQDNNACELSNLCVVSASAALRYFFTLPMMAVLLLREKRISAVLKAIGKAPVSWMLWSTVGFGLFYAPLSAASVYAESWFTAATWQLTIVAGILLTPLFRKKIPVKNLLLV